MNVPWHIKASNKLAAMKKLDPTKTQTWFADEVGVSKSSVTLWFKGEVTPPFKRFERIGAVLDMTIEELVGDDDRFARTGIELAALFLIRGLDEKQREKALDMFQAIALGLKASSSLPNPHINSTD